MSERESLPKLKERRKLIRLNDKINGIIEELLEEGESDITDINTRCSWAVTFISLVYHSTCFGGFLHPSSEVYNCICSPWYKCTSENHLPTWQDMNCHVGRWLPEVHSYQGLHIQLYTPDDGCKKRPKHVEW